MKRKPETSRHQGPVRVVTYSRVSTDEQVANGTSIDQQPVLIRRALDARYGPGGYVVIADISDPGYSGSWGPTMFRNGSRSNRNRPGLTEVFRLVEARAVDVVAVQDVSRLYRRTGAMLGFIEELLIPNDVDLFSVNEPLDIHTPEGSFQGSILAAAADFQLAGTRKKVRRNLEQRRRDGLWQGSAPYGWRFATAAEVEAGAQKTLVPIPEQLVGVARAAELYLSGHSFRQVAKRLNEEAIPWTRNHNRPEKRRVERWTDTRVKLVLRCPAQAGLVRTSEGELVAAKHAPHAPITVEQFEQIQHAMDERRTRFRGVTISKPEFVLSGIVTCAVCGGKLMAKRMGNGEYAYICPARRLVEDGDHPPIWARNRSLEQLVVSQLGRFAGQPEELDEARRLIHLKATEGSGAEEAELARVKAELDRLGEEKSRLTEKLAQGVLDDETYRSYLQERRSQESDLHAHALKLEKSVAGVMGKEATLRKALDALKCFPNCWSQLEPCEQAEMLRSSVESLTVGADESGNYVRLKLHNFDAVTLRLPRHFAEAMKRGSGPDSLTYAELSVLYYFEIGKRASEIAEVTGRTKSTISTICGRILQRLDVTDMKAAVKRAGKLAIEFAETFDLDDLRKKRRRATNALSPMEQMAIDMKKKGYTPKEMSDLGISPKRVEDLLASANRKLDLSGGGSA